ncbi:MAG: nucleotidyltransferase family protein [Desulfomonilaceae bacterium]
MIDQTSPFLKPKKITALVLSAGLSSRMTVFKPLLKFGSKTILEHVVLTLRESGIEDILVVVGYRAEDLIPMLQNMHIRWIKNVNYEKGMLSSIKTGISTIGKEFDAFLVMPVDIPLVKTRTIVELVLAFQESSRLICYPNFRGRRGHPPIISTQYGDEILLWDKPGGLKGFLRQKEAEALDLKVEDESVLMDMDTLEDYKRLLEIFERR